MANQLPRLRYFMFPGRCYAARIAMFNALGKDGWVDERIGQGAFKKLKQQALEDRTNQKLPMDAALLTDNMPQLILPNGSTHCQSHAIARWAARQTGGKFNLYPLDDADSCLLVDETMALVDSVVGLAPKDVDAETRLAKRKAYIAPGTGPLHVAMSILESRLAQSGGPFLLGGGEEHLTIADLYVKKPLTDMILDKQFEGVGPSWLQQFPLLMKHTAAIADHSLVVEYLTKYKN